MKIFEKQLWQLISYLILLGVAYFLVDKGYVSMTGEMWGVSTSTWIILALAAPAVHQLYVVVCWRSELHYKALSRKLGPLAFRLYMIGFFILFASRMVFFILLAVSNHDSLILPSWIFLSCITLFSIISVYAFFSVVRFFGMERAAGLDHFEPKARELPIVRRGIFKFTKNGMYVFAFLIFYLPGLFAHSSAALLAALISHIFIWAHHYFTEVPDMKKIYGDR